MKLGLIINSDSFTDVIINLTQSAVSKEKEVRLFFMDEGTKLLENQNIIALSSLEKVSMSFCEYSAKKNHINFMDLPKKIKKGSQINNAIMNQSSDKVLVF